MHAHRSRRFPPSVAVVTIFAATFFAALVWAQDGERVGSETCAMCHEDVATAFASSKHWVTDPENSCENCHGPGAAHVDEGDPELIRTFGEGTVPAELNRVCLDCHERRGSQGDFHRSEHGRADLACTACHSPHEAAHEKNLRAATPALCYQCHQSVRAQFALNERHPVEQGSVKCQDCHDVHARSERTSLGGFKQESCLECHAEYRGPWIFEHEAVTIEGCTSCHAPHGSVNRHMLQYQRVSDLCLQCHPGQPFFHDLADSSGARTTQFNDCTACHSEIHGSNNDALFLN